MSPLPTLIRNGTPSQRALSMYKAAAKNVGVAFSVSPLPPGVGVHCPSITSLGSNFRIDLNSLTWLEF